YRLELGGFLVPPLAVPQHVLIAQFISHTLLILLMTVATFIDFDEKTIPDTITIPGTLIALLLITCWPQGGALPQIDVGLSLQPLWLSTFTVWWMRELNSWPGLLLGIACFVAWCYALIPKLATLRRGWRKGWIYLHASTFRSSAWWQMGLMAMIG